MDIKVKFFFYLASVICFALATAGSGWRFGRRGRAGLAPMVALEPLGLLLFVFPSLWDVGVLAF
ncbi:MAG: hypothetical protein M3378_10125 [Actinomycetota bacterium]|nr:hypothetical protein [Actinomycetota bacterium]MDQ3680877.1 hypothetical protein [Actinomycetota bacterium]